MVSNKINVHLYSFPSIQDSCANVSSSLNRSGCSTSILIFPQHHTNQHNIAPRARGRSAPSPHRAGIKAAWFQRRPAPSHRSTRMHRVSHSASFAWSPQCPPRHATTAETTVHVALVRQYYTGPLFNYMHHARWVQSRKRFHSFTLKQCGRYLLWFSWKIKFPCFSIRNTRA